MESQDLEFFEELIDSYQHQHDVGLRRIAATLAYLAQKDRPLQIEGADIPEETFVPPSKKHKNDFPDGNLARYRIEVGHTHGVEPKHIVGAIANEININSRDIGQIKIYNDHSLVDLPKAMPAAAFRKLQKVWVCGQQLQASPVHDQQAVYEKTKRSKGRKSTESKTFKGKKSAPRNRRGKR